MPLSSTQLWSKPLAVTSCGWASRMSRPIGLARRKSKGVPDTRASSPVGIRPASVGVKREAAIDSSWSSIVPLPSPARFQ